MIFHSTYKRFLIVLGRYLVAAADDETRVRNNVQLLNEAICTKKIFWCAVIAIVHHSVDSRISALIDEIVFRVIHTSLIFS